MGAKKVISEPKTKPVINDPNKKTISPDKNKKPLITEPVVKKGNLLND